MDSFGGVSKLCLGEDFVRKIRLLGRVLFYVPLSVGALFCVLCMCICLSLSLPLSHCVSITARNPTICELFKLGSEWG